MNLEKLDEAIAYIEAHPEQHDQMDWFIRKACGTTACLAGTIAQLDGWRPNWDMAYDDYDGEEQVVAGVIKDGHRPMLASVVAQHIAGLTALQARALFHEARDLDEIKQLRGRIAAGEL